MKKSSVAKATNEEEEAPLYSHCLNPANAIAYTRLVLLTGSWVCLSLRQPLIFVELYVVQLALEFVELAFFASKKNAELQK
jgi:hypothetical protein